MSIARRDPSAARAAVPAIADSININSDHSDSSMAWPMWFSESTAYQQNRPPGVMPEIRAAVGVPARRRHGPRDTRDTEAPTPAPMSVSGRTFAPHGTGGHGLIARASRQSPEPSRANHPNGRRHPFGRSPCFRAALRYSRQRPAIRSPVLRVRRCLRCRSRSETQSSRRRQRPRRHARVARRR